MTGDQRRLPVILKKNSPVDSYATTKAMFCIDNLSFTGGKSNGIITCKFFLRGSGNVYGDGRDLAAEDKEADWYGVKGHFRKI